MAISELTRLYNNCTEGNLKLRVLLNILVKYSPNSIIYLFNIIILSVNS